MRLGVAALYVLLSFAVAIPVAAIAAPVTTTIDFESPDTSPAFFPVVGNKAQGSKSSVTTDSPHGGASSLRLDLTFSANLGTMEIGLPKPVVVATGDGTLKMSVWVKGAGAPLLQTGGLRLIDSKGELFQYQIKGLPEAFNGSDWQLVNVDLDVMKYAATWGPNTDGQIKYPLKFLSFVSDHVKGGEMAGTLYFDDISFTSEVIPRPVLDKLTADRELLVAKTGETVAFTASVRDVDTAKGPLTATWTVKDVDGNVLKDATSPVSGANVTYAFTSTEPGWVGIECQLKDDRGNLGLPSSSALAIMEQQGSVHSAADPYYFGVCAHLLSSPVLQSDKEIALMKAAGFGACRLDFVWQIIQPTEDKINWSKPDDYVTKLVAAGVIPCPNMGYSAHWASTAPTTAKSFQEWAFAAPMQDKYAAFIKAAVERYKGQVHHWEIWNEPDLGFWRGTVDQYGDLLGAAVMSAHQADPKALVMNGGISERYEFKKEFTPQFLTRSNPKPDIFAYHSHGPLDNLYVASAKVREMLKAAGMEKTPIWLNEAGMAAMKSWGVSERDKALILVKKMATSQALGDRAYMLYDLRNDGDNPTDPEANYGIVKRDFTPLPAFVAVHTLIAALSGKAFTGSLNVAPGATAYSYAAGGNAVVASWSSARSASASGLLRTNAKSATLTDMMGRVRTVPISGGVVPLSVGYDPTVLTLIGQTGPVMTLDSPLDCASVAGYAGSSGSLAVTIKNPLSKKLTGTLDVKAAGVDVQQLSTPLTIAPGASQVVNVAFSLQAANGGKRSLTLTLTSSDLPTIVRSVPCVPALILPSVARLTDPWSATPTVSLQVPQNAVILYAATYEDALKLKPGNDLAANAWLRATPAGIQVRLDVTDDVQFQDNSGVDMWKADSVQLALSTTSGRNYEWVAGLTPAGPSIARTQWPAAALEPSTAESVKIQRTGNVTSYEMLLPAGIADIAQAMKDGCSISFLVNDNDGKGRKGWVEWTPGIGVRKEPSQYKRVLFEAR
ncbi:MAG TPA: hypothetical protein VGK19_20625 [Capsulimonadaceae bacterium]|jgi:hypothetical protein